MKKRKRIILSDSDEELDQEQGDRSKTIKIDQPDIEMKDSSQKTNDNMDIDTETGNKTEKLEHSDDEAFDKEIEQAAAEEKEAKKEKLEMMSIIHTM